MCRASPSSTNSTGKAYNATSPRIFTWPLRLASLLAQQDTQLVVVHSHRTGANPWKPINDMRTMLGLNAAAVQVPIGEEAGLEGYVDLVRKRLSFSEAKTGRR